jgi:hypothetical protein
MINFFKNIYYSILLEINYKRNLKKRKDQDPYIYK